MNKKSYKTMKVCFFGIYNPAYSRNRVLIRGFQESGYEIVHCRIDPREHYGVRKYWKLFQVYRKVRKIEFDIVLVAFPGHTVMWLAYLLFGRNVIFDAFVSLYNSEVEDRKTTSALSLKAVYYWLLDWASCILANKILLDTNAHVAYFVKRYHISANKFIRIFVGTTPKDFYQLPQKEDTKFIVHFHGHFTPLHGVEYIIEAANILGNNKDIQFRIIGDGIGESIFIEKSLHHNVEFIRSVTLPILNKYINDAGICLGIFGGTVKSGMVIPNKIYEALACKKPVITQESKAITELLVDKENVVLCRSTDARDLAEKILALKEDADLREEIALNGYNIFVQKLQPCILVSEIV